MTEELIKAIQELKQQYTYWDYIMFGADVISVIISAIALIAAINIPKKVAKSQNDIALFEKRYQLYEVINHLVKYGKTLMKIKDLKNKNGTFRARNYLKVYILTKNQNYFENDDIGLVFKYVYDDNEELLGYELLFQSKEEMESYKLRLRQHIDIYKTTVELTSFLFAKDIEELLQKLAATYFAFMNLVYEYAKFGNNDIVKNDDDNSLQELAYITCEMEKNMVKFLNVIQEISDKNILEEIKGYLRLKE